MNSRDVAEWVGALFVVTEIFVSNLAMDALMRARKKYPEVVFPAW